MPNVISCANFQLDRFRGFWAPGGRKSPFPIDYRYRPYNCVRTNVLHCDLSVSFLKCHWRWVSLWLQSSRAFSFPLPGVDFCPPSLAPFSKPFCHWAVQWLLEMPCYSLHLQLQCLVVGVQLHDQFGYSCPVKFWHISLSITALAKYTFVSWLENIKGQQKAQKLRVVQLIKTMHRNGL